MTPRWFNPKHPRTRWFRFVGANIKGTPSMSAAKVAQDLRVLVAEAEVIVTQEFKWGWYWTTARRILQGAKVGHRWSSSPTFAAGIANAAKSAQSVFWRRSLWKRRRTLVHLLHKASRHSTNRYQRAVLLEDRQSGLAFWAYTTHCAVGGARKDSDPERKRLLDTDLANMNRTLAQLVATGFPIVGQLDANVPRDSAAFPRFMALLDRRGASLHGPLGVEYLFTIPGADGTRVEVRNTWEVGTNRLNTDHEARGATVRLVRPVK